VVWAAGILIYLLLLLIGWLFLYAAGKLSEGKPHDDGSGGKRPRRRSSKKKVPQQLPLPLALPQKSNISHARISFAAALARRISFTFPNPPRP
jgi:hypothetical protein